MNGTLQTVQITSTPPGASVVIEPTRRDRLAPASRDARTPVSVELKRGYEYEVAFSLDGYRPVSRLVKQMVSGAVMGNLLVGGLVAPWITKSLNKR